MREEKKFRKGVGENSMKEKLDLGDWIFIIAMYIVFGVMVVLFYFAKN